MDITVAFQMLMVKRWADTSFILRTSMRRYVKMIVDNIYDESPLLKLLNKE